MAKRRDAESVARSRRLQAAFGERLQRARRNAQQGRIQQETLATALGISRTSVSNIERGQHRIFLDQVYSAANALGVRIEDLLPSLEEVFPASPVLTAPGAGMTERSVREVEELAREIQDRAARDERPSLDTSLTRTLKRR